MNRVAGAARSERENGFTIIEVLFFLAISGGLVAALLATVGFTISRQRFTDSVVSTQSYVQSQYNETLNVINDRSGTSCSQGNGNTTAVGSGTTPRGASACVVLGKAIDVTPGSSRMTAYTVVGREPAETDGVSGGALLALYAPAADPASAQSFDAPWDASVTGLRRQSGDPISRLLLLRSPDSGLVLTFGGGSNITDALRAGTGTFALCLKSADISGAVSAVTLSPVSGSEGVTTESDLSPSRQADVC